MPQRQLFRLIVSIFGNVPTASLPESLQADARAPSYTGNAFLCGLDARGTSIGGLTAINDHEFLVIERKDRSGVTEPLGGASKGQVLA